MKKLFILLFFTIPALLGFSAYGQDLDSDSVVIDIQKTRKALEEQLQKIETDRIKIIGILEYLQYLEAIKNNETETR